MMNGNGFDGKNGHSGHQNRLPSDSEKVEDDPEAIKDRMAMLRRGLKQDAVQLAHTAKQATDWKFYVQKFPLACAGVALLVGYALVPGRKGPLTASDDQLQRLAKAGQLKVVAEPAPGTKPSLVRKAMFAIGGLALRAALDQVGQSISGPMAARASHNGHPKPSREL